MAGPVPPSAGTAKTLILIGLILEFIGAIIVLGIGAVSLVVISVYGVFFLVAGIIGLLILWLVYTYTYKRIVERNYEGARTPTIIWTIILFLTLNIISAILFLIAYIKLGDAVRESQQPPYAAPYGVPPYGQPVYGQPVPAYGAPGTAGMPPGAIPSSPMGTAAPSAPPSAAPICPRCGNPATYIPQYGRWYCYRDQTYL